MELIKSSFCGKSNQRGDQKRKKDQTNAREDMK